MNTEEKTQDKAKELLEFVMDWSGNLGEECEKKQELCNNLASSISSWCPRGFEIVDTIERRLHAIADAYEEVAPFCNDLSAEIDNLISNNNDNVIITKELAEQYLERYRALSDKVQAIGTDFLNPDHDDDDQEQGGPGQ